MWRSLKTFDISVKSGDRDRDPDVPKIPGNNKNLNPENFHVTKSRKSQS